MGITGVVRDKDTELGIADAVIAVDGINHDVTTGVLRGYNGAGGWGWGFESGSEAEDHHILILAFTPLSMGWGLLAPADPWGLHGDSQC